MPKRFDLIVAPSAVREMNDLRPFVRRQIRDAIVQQLPFEPTKPARNRKMLAIEEASFDFSPPLWELRIGDHRVFYDVDLVDEVVYVRSVRLKPPHHTTDEVL